MQSPVPSLEWEITRRCNYTCSYCCQKQPTLTKTKHSSNQTVEAILNFLADLPEIYLVKLIGGEPMIHPDFQDICTRWSEPYKTGKGNR